MLRRGSGHPAIPGNFSHNQGYYPSSLLVALVLMLSFHPTSSSEPTNSVTESTTSLYVFNTKTTTDLNATTNFLDDSQITTTDSMPNVTNLDLFTQTGLRNLTLMSTIVKSQPAESNTTFGYGKEKVIQQSAKTTSRIEFFVSYLVTKTPTLQNLTTGDVNDSTQSTTRRPSSRAFRGAPSAPSSLQEALVFKHVSTFDGSTAATQLVPEPNTNYVVSVVNHEEPDSVYNYASTNFLDSGEDQNVSNTDTYENVYPTEMPTFTLVSKHNSTVITGNYGLFIAKVCVMVLIITVAVLGNSLVIVSISLHRRLHCPANYLLVSLATADLLVALCAMTFNLSVELSAGIWLFGDIMCDLWNSFDVYFSTVSILHLCSISVDRYYAIVRPLEYPQTMTKNMLTYMLCQAWIAPALISFLPIFLGWYTTKEHLKQRLTNPSNCTFNVNPVYAIMSSSVSFWLPCTVMAVMYFRIFQEARKQERAMLTRASSSASSAAARLNGTAADPRQQLLAALQGIPLTATPKHQEFIMKTLTDDSCASSSTACAMNDNNVSKASGRVAGCSKSTGTVTGSCRRTVTKPPPPQVLWPEMVTSPKRNTSGSSGGTSGTVGKREHKAARTLGLIMGAFVMCWLPFFTWYISTNICGPKCACPPSVVTTVFWIGYFNSTLNPFIYAYVRADFRHAFRSTLTRCCRPRYPTGDFV